jgi:hypothetical protein
VRFQGATVVVNRIGLQFIAMLFIEMPLIEMPFEDAKAAGNGRQVRTRGDRDKDH